MHQIQGCNSTNMSLQNPAHSKHNNSVMRIIQTTNLQDEYVIAEDIGGIDESMLIYELKHTVVDQKNKMEKCPNNLIL